jgi:hypothetical protein
MHSLPLALYKIRVFNESKKPVAVLHVIEATKKTAYLTCLQLLPEHKTWQGFYKRTARGGEKPGVLYFKPGAQRSVKHKKHKFPQMLRA